MTPSRPTNVANASLNAESPGTKSFPCASSWNRSAAKRSSDRSMKVDKSGSSNHPKVEYAAAPRTWASNPRMAKARAARRARSKPKKPR